MGFCVGGFKTEGYLFHLLSSSKWKTIPTTKMTHRLFRPRNLQNPNQLCFYNNNKKRDLSLNLP